MLVITVKQPESYKDNDTYLNREIICENGQLALFAPDQKKERIATYHDASINQDLGQLALFAFIKEERYVTYEEQKLVNEIGQYALFACVDDEPDTPEPQKEDEKWASGPTFPKDIPFGD